MIELKIKAYLEKHPHWITELTKLRDVITKTELEEKVKWGMPVYTINNKNVVGLAGFKSYFGLWFFQGSFLKDDAKILINAQEGKTKGMRHLKFSSWSDVDIAIIKSYIDEAIQNAHDGKEVKPEKKSIAMPKEFKEALDNDNKLKTAFANFSKGKQNEFLEFIGSAKRKNTIEKRLEASIEMIMKGESPMDKYRKK